MGKKREFKRKGLDCEDCFRSLVDVDKGRVERRRDDQGNGGMWRW